MAKKMVALKLPRYQHDKRDSRYQQLNYSQAAPFFANPNGVLVHRVRALYRLTVSESRSWWIIDYWCGNGGRSDAIDDELLFDPGKKLICARCEALATTAGEPMSSKLAGRHVCTGVCRPVNTCCTHEDN